MSLIINELTIQTKLVDEFDDLNKNEISKALDILKAENIKLKKEIKMLQEKFENIRHIDQ